MPVDAVRVRSVDDVVLAFFETERDATEAERRRWFDALEADGIKKTMILSVGAVHSDPERRRVGVDLLMRRGIRVVAVTDHRFNRGLLSLVSWLGVSTSGYPWSKLEDAARDVASRPEMIKPIVRAALALRAESPSAVGLAPTEG